MNKNIYAFMRQWGVLTVTGPEARSFLHRLTTINMNRFESGKLQEGCLLNPTGKIVVFFKLLQGATDQFFLVCAKLSADYTMKNVFDAFENLHFRENLKIEDVTHGWNYIRAIGNAFIDISDEQVEAKEKAFFWRESDWNNLSESLIDIGCLVPVSEIQKIQGLLNSADFLEVESLENIRVQRGAPGPGHEITPDVLPLEISLDSAVHENKGCYPGQEVIERLRSMGQAPRKLLLLKTKVESGGVQLSVPAELRSEGHPCGTITSAIRNDDNTVTALAVVKKTFLEKQNFSALGQTFFRTN